MILKCFAIALGVHRELLAARHSYAFDWFGHTTKTMTLYFDRYPAKGRKRMQSEV